MKTKSQKLLEKVLIFSPDFLLKSKIRAIEEEVKGRNKNRSLTSPLTNQEKILLKFNN